MKLMWWLFFFLYPSLFFFDCLFLKEKMLSLLYLVLNDTWDKKYSWFVVIMAMPHVTKKEIKILQDTLFKQKIEFSFIFFLRSIRVIIYLHFFSLELRIWSQYNIFQKMLLIWYNKILDPDSPPNFLHF